MTSNSYGDLLDYFPKTSTDRITALGLGTAGCRILSKIESNGLRIDKYAYISCEKTDFDFSQSEKKLFLDIDLRSKSSPSRVRGAARKYSREIRELISDSKIVFIVSGLGGFNGSGLTPLVANIAKEEGVLTVSVVAMPFGFEKSKHFFAGTSLKLVRQNSDAVIVIDNDAISINEEQIPISKIYELVNEKISLALSKIIESSGELSIGLNRLVQTITNDRYTLLSIGTSSAVNKAEEATTKAIESIYRLAEPEETCKSILYLVGDNSVIANEIVTSTSRLNTMLGNGDLEVNLGFSANGGSGMMAILLASGFKTTKFDNYDPLEKILRNLEIDSDTDCLIDEDISNITQLER